MISAEGRKIQEAMHGIACNCLRCMTKNKAWLGGLGEMVELQTCLQKEAERLIKRIFDFAMI